MCPKAVFNKFPVIELEQFRLRELTEHDAAGLLEYISDPEVNRYISDEDTPKNIQEAFEEVKYWSSLFHYKRSVYWTIARKKDDKIIGSCGYNMWSMGHARGEISYDLARSCWNRGVMTKALKAITDFGFEKMKLNRIQATVAISNAASIRVLEKLGFKREGCLQEFGKLKESFEDSYMYAILRKDWEVQ